MTDALWVLGRASGVVALLLLTVVTALGVATQRGRPLVGLPRFAVAAVHRNAALLSVVFLTVHVLTLLADPYAGLSPVSSVVPFTAPRDPFWYGLGAVVVDLLVAVVVTSLLRTRLSLRAWRAVHLASYACWPVALVHGLGSGSDVGSGWMLGLTVASVAVVASAVLIRFRNRSASDRPVDRARHRTARPTSELR